MVLILPFRKIYQVIYIFQLSLIKHLIKALYKAVFTFSNSSINTIWVSLDNKSLASIKNYYCRFMEIEYFFSVLINYPCVTYKLSPNSLNLSCPIFNISSSTVFHFPNRHSCKTSAAEISSTCESYTHDWSL